LLIINDTRKQSVVIDVHATMKAALLYGVNDLRIVQVEKPSPGPGDVVCEIKACGVCPTDIRKYRTGDHGVPTIPFNMGHEWTGNIVEVGEAVNGFKVGMRVAGMNYGGYAEYNRVSQEEFEEFSPYPETLLLPIPDDVSYESGIFLEPLADCFHAVVTQAQVHVGDTLLVIGAGQMGLQLLMAAKSTGAKVIVTDFLDSRLKSAKQFGADFNIKANEENLKDRVKEITRGRGVDAVITSVGQPSAIVQALEVVAKRGRVVIFGGAPKGTTVQIDPNIIHYNEISLIGTEWIGVGGFLDARMCHLALEMIRTGKAPVERLITHRYLLDEIHEALQAAENLEGLKSLVTIH
jgi:L-iditol 2-dehydrogenase